ncbi:retroviral-like aspartic protease family protein [Chitinophaga sp. GCM10012297]|uniref:Retroviral-like aspartic protease family protein n=1 Tax=Chitinophaga chungangae TaxID=2821488 RepID=A0ABS3YBQ7_9BACT|nr:retroviral-like aspartic protease family protein [Chitinophaga chungangae]MBO9152104.1 retroviral-like aspartic protease family protein [Chitinophaga chungangae]
MRPIPFLAFAALLFSLPVFCQPVYTQKDYVMSKEGYPLFLKVEYLRNCRRDIGGGENSPEANSICECMLSRLDRRYPMQKIKTFQKKYKQNAITELVKQDSLLEKEYRECYEAGSKSNIFFTSAHIRRFRDNMVKRYLFEEKDSGRRAEIEQYCDCAVKVIQKKKMTAEMLDEMVDENSLLSNEIRYNCGDILKTSGHITAWSDASRNDISGPDADTVYVLQLQNTTKVKVKIGPFINAWTLDSGADDLLVSDSLVNRLLELKLLSPQDYLGEGTYRVANDQPMQVKIYRLPQLQIGSFTIRNVILTSGKTVKTYLLGKGVLNKFSRWTLDNRREMLILEK